jgi:hypothetical protein
VNEVRHHRARGVPRERHWIGAVISGVGTAFGIGTSIYGASRSGGKLTPNEKHYIEVSRQREDEAYRFQQLMMPYTLESLGLDAEYGPNGQVISVKRRPKTGAELQQEEITDLAQKRAIKALKGELDIDPATERSIKRNQQLKQEQVRRTYGPQGDATTGGQNMLAAAQAGADVSREAVRRGELTQVEAMARANQQLMQQRQDFQARQSAGLPLEGLRMAQQMTPWDSYLGGADRLNRAAQNNFYAHLGGTIGSGAASLADQFQRYRRSRTTTPGVTDYGQYAQFGMGGNLYGPDEAPFNWSGEAY